MDPEQIKLIRLSMVRIMENKIAVGMVFYDHLFEIAPDTRAMFTGDIQSQAANLIEMLSISIGSLRDTATLNLMLESLGRRHLDYGVVDAHYQQVGAALIWALEKSFGDDFTPQLREAWSTLYTSVADIMMNAASGESQSVSA